MHNSKAVCKLMNAVVTYAGSVLDMAPVVRVEQLMRSHSVDWTGMSSNKEQ